MKSKISRLVYILYILILVSSYFLFYNLLPGENLSFTIIYFYFLFPIFTYLVSYYLSKNTKSSIKVVIPFILSILYISPILIFIIKSDITFLSVFKLYYGILLYPFIISLLGVIIGNKNTYSESILYTILKPFIKVFVFFINPKYEGLENINISNKRIIYAGNHTSILDPLLLIAISKRNIHFLSKKELFKFPLNIIFNNLGLIPVDRSKKDKNSLIMAREYLNNNLVIGIFPEGTISKDKKLLPFKYGAVKLAKDTKTSIIPFSITGDYKLFSKSLKIKFGKEIEINNDLEIENKKLREKIKQMIKEG